MVMNFVKYIPKIGIIICIAKKKRIVQMNLYCAMIRGHFMNAWEVLNKMFRRNFH